MVANLARLKRLRHWFLWTVTIGLLAHLLSWLIATTDRSASDAALTSLGDGDLLLTASLTGAAAIGVALGLRTKEQRMVFGGLALVFAIAAMGLYFGFRGSLNALPPTFLPPVCEEAGALVWLRQMSEPESCSPATKSELMRAEYFETAADVIAQEEVETAKWQQELDGSRQLAFLSGLVLWSGAVSTGGIAVWKR